MFIFTAGGGLLTGTTWQVIDMQNNRSVVLEGENSCLKRVKFVVNRKKTVRESPPTGLLIKTM